MTSRAMHPTVAGTVFGRRASWLVVTTSLLVLCGPSGTVRIEAGEAKTSTKSSRKTPASRKPSGKVAGGEEVAGAAGAAVDAKSEAGAPRAGADVAEAQGDEAATGERPEKFEIPVQPSPEVGSSASAPASPRDPTAAQLSAAVAAAEKELDEVRASAEAEARDMGGAVAQITKDNVALRERQRALEGQLRKAEADLQKKSAELEERKKSRAAAEGALEMTRGELEAQAATLEERFANSLVASEDPELLAGIRALKPGGASADDATGKVRKLLGLYSKALDHARTASVLVARIQLPAQGGKLDRVEVLRLGLIGGYYAQTSGSEVGFVVADSEGEGGLKGEPRGVSAAQAVAIRAALADPSSGGTLPFDVTGGQGLVAMQTAETWGRWFELGGFAMWPLLAVCLAAVFLILERTVTLGWQSFGIRRKIDQVIALVRQGRMEEAEARCAKAGGAVGSVLHAALVHRDKDRSVMEDAVQEALLHWAPKFQARLGFISLCAAVAPLLGLFGTVTGMITTFKMVTLFGTSDPRFLAGGISEALITTEAGLMIAIPALLMRGLLGAMADSALGKLETGALSLVLQLSRAEESLAEARGVA